VVRRVSDIQSKWVGESERNLANAFDEARAARGVLLIDEFDWIVRDRGLAHAGWEVSLANEFLQQLEACEGVVACTTNLMDALDPAVLRRFTHRIAFRPLRPDQAVALFEALLGGFVQPALDAAARQDVERELRAVGQLVPGDFAAVARRLTIGSEPITWSDAVAELRAESSGRRRERHVGFVPPEVDA
jgi:SpoVK/Ycf46/Vps4 family AAA+-type ATPase